MELAHENSKDYYNPDFKKKAIILKKVTEAKEDEGFKILLNESVFFRQVIIDFYIDMIHRIKELTNSIEKELKELKN